VRLVFERIGKESGRWERVDAGAERDVVESVIWGYVEKLEGNIEGPGKQLWEEHLPTN